MGYGNWFLGPGKGSVSFLKTLAISDLGERKGQQSILSGKSEIQGR